ncbi:MAG: DUF1501 domain-containing protein [Planctomycetota bacterium]|nr:DUF1501 domain-containing protein [Planctomycetota bacterium]MEE3366613.1 DUF1501 domain-containing protein [Planctomycetota bacterium]
MLRIDAGRSGRYCDGMSRRSFVQLGVAGMAAASLGDVARAKQSAATGNNNAAIMIWLDGGPSHLDMYDMKPEAPSEYRGIWMPTATNVPGVEITEMFPLQAQHADKFSIVRSLHHDTGGHFHGGHFMLTTKSLGPNNTGTFPSIGSIVARERGPRRSGMPSYISVPVASSIGLRPGYFGGNWMGMQYDPFQTGGDPNNANFKVANLNLASGMTVDRLASRRDLNRSLDRIEKTVERGTLFEAMDKFDRDAFEFVSGAAARKAFDINKEDPRLRDQYGRSNWGQSTLLARRLVEAGSTFVTVHFGGWDHHWNLEPGYKSVLPRVDMAVSGLLKDLSDRGMLESTLVILCGEFSRTPRMNDGGNGGPPGSKGTPGRDHWGNSLFCLLAGGGIKGGQVVGSTNAKGERPLTRAVKPCNLHATIYKALGMDPTLHLLDHQGRPTPVLEDPTPIHELL